MKLQCIAYKKEGFVSGYGIVLQDGKTILRTKTDLVWAGKEVREAEIKALCEFLDVLEILGMELQGRDIIPEPSNA